MLLSLQMSRKSEDTASTVKKRKEGGLETLFHSSLILHEERERNFKETHVHCPLFFRATHVLSFILCLLLNQMKRKGERKERHSNGRHKKEDMEAKKGTDDVEDGRRNNRPEGKKY